MKPIIFCEFNLDTASVELKLLDGMALAIDTIAEENIDYHAGRFGRSVQSFPADLGL